MADYIWNKKIHITINHDDENGIVLDTEQGEYFQVHGLYTVIAELCQKKLSLMEIKNELNKDFENVEWNDVLEIMDEYQNKGWIIND